ncbi:OmpA family protein [Aquifex sp.]
MILNLALLLLIAGLAYSQPRCNIPYHVDIKYITVKEVGKKYRKTDVIIRIPLVTKTIKRATIQEKPAVNLEFKTEEDKATTQIQAIRPLKRDLLLVQPIKEGFVYEEAHVKRIISKSPEIEEVFIVYPVDVKKNYIAFPLPSISVGEKLIVEYRFKGKLRKPYVKYVELKKPIPKKENAVLKVKYSFLFRYAKAEVNDENIKNIKALLKQIEKYGIKAHIEIVGYADGKSTNSKRNEEVARKRALEIARRIFPKDVVACLISGAPSQKLKN